eukprot:jgi/Tetstr1/448966/TSEL_036191.t1
MEFIHKFVGDTVQNLRDFITDGGGLATVTVHHNISDTLEGATSAAVAVTGGPVASDAFTELDDATKLYVWVPATDAAGNAATTVRGGEATTPDATDPTISGFDAAQGPRGYTFSATTGTVADNVDWYVDAFLVISPSATLGAGDLQTIVGADCWANLRSGAKALNNAYKTAPGTFDVRSVLSPSTDRYNNGFGFGFTPITEASPDLYAYILVVMDAAGNASIAINSGGAKAVLDRTPPAFLGTLTVVASGSDAITVSGLDGWSDGGSGIGGVTAYCGTTAPNNVSATDMATWAALGTTASASVASPGDASVAVTWMRTRRTTCARRPSTRPGTRREYKENIESRQAEYAKRQEEMKHKAIQEGQKRSGSGGGECSQDDPSEETRVGLVGAMLAAGTP